MTQSVELLLDPAAEAAVRDVWLRLHEAGLPSELRLTDRESHRPHLTLFAGANIAKETDATLSALLADLPLHLLLGVPMMFGPYRERYVLVHQVVPTAALLELQRRVALACGADPLGHFGAGRWSPHVTLARRLTPIQVSAALRILGSADAVGRRVVISQCRRWDGTARTTWLL